MPSIVTPLAVMVGRAEASVIVCGPAPGIAKVTVAGLGAVLAQVTASLSDPVPLSLVFVTIPGDGLGRIENAPIVHGWGLWSVKRMVVVEEPAVVLPAPMTSAAFNTFHRLVCPANGVTLLTASLAAIADRTIWSVALATLTDASEEPVPLANCDAEIGLV